MKRQNHDKYGLKFMKNNNIKEKKHNKQKQLEKMSQILLDKCKLLHVSIQLEQITLQNPILAIKLKIQIEKINLIKEQANIKQFRKAIHASSLYSTKEKSEIIASFNLTNTSRDRPKEQNKNKVWNQPPDILKHYEQVQEGNKMMIPNIYLSAIISFIKTLPILVFLLVYY